MSKIKALLDKYNNIEKELHDLFGFPGYWKLLPIDDMTEAYWLAGNIDNIIWCLRNPKRVGIVEHVHKPRSVPWLKKPIPEP